MCLCMRTVLYIEAKLIHSGSLLLIKMIFFLSRETWQMKNQSTVFFKLSIFHNNSGILKYVLFEINGEFVVLFSLSWARFIETKGLCHLLLLKIQGKNHSQDHHYTLSIVPERGGLISKHMRVQCFKAIKEVPCVFFLLCADISQDKSHFT